MYTYSAVCTRVVDGDTIDVDVDLGFVVFTRARLRFARINAPETRTRDLAEKERGYMAKDLIKSAIEGNDNKVRVTTTEKGKYGRWIAEIYVGETNLSDLLLENGLAKLVEY